MISKEELSFNFCLGIIELRRLFLDGVCDSWLFLKYLVDHFACFSDICILTLDFGGSIGHFIDWLVNYNFGITFPHDFVDLMTFGSNEERNHAFRNKYYNGKLLFFNRFKHLINIMKKALRTLILFFHLIIKNLYTYHLYLYVSAIQIRNS